MDRLYQVVLRWFDLNIQFDSLTPNQAGKLFARVLADLQGYTRPGRYAESVKLLLSRFSTLTPGDFATVVRQARVQGKSYDSERLMTTLKEECRAKPRGMTGVICNHGRSYGTRQGGEVFGLCNQ